MCVYVCGPTCDVAKSPLSHCKRSGVLGLLITALKSSPRFHGNARGGLHKARLTRILAMWQVSRQKIHRKISFVDAGPNPRAKAVLWREHTLFKTCTLRTMFAFKRQSTTGGSLSWWLVLCWRSGRREVWNTVWEQDNRLCNLTEVHNVMLRFPAPSLLVFAIPMVESGGRVQLGHDFSQQDEVFISARGSLKVSWWLWPCPFHVVSSADLLWLWEDYRRGVVRRAHCCYFSWRNKILNKIIWKVK